MSRPDTYKKIVVALDGSSDAYHAAKIAIQIAQLENLAIEGLYIVDEPLVLDPYADHSQELGSDQGNVSRAILIERYKAFGYKVLDQLRVECESKGIPIETEILLGDIPDLILNKSEQAAFLAMGRRGNRHDTDQEHLGENFHHVAHHTKVPLIIGGKESSEIKRVYLFCDGTEDAKKSLELAIDLQQRKSVDVIVGLLEHPEAELDLKASRAWFKERGLSVEKVQDLQAAHIYTISDRLNFENIDFCILSGYQHQEFVARLVGSFVDHFLSQSELPVLIP